LKVSRRESQEGRQGRGLVLVVSEGLVTKLKSPERRMIGRRVGRARRKRERELLIRLQKCSWERRVAL
jgi:hypothetical protein